MQLSSFCLASTVYILAHALLLPWPLYLPSSNPDYMTLLGIVDISTKAFTIWLYYVGLKESLCLPIPPSFIICKWFDCLKSPGKWAVAVKDVNLEYFIECALWNDIKWNTRGLYFVVPIALLYIIIDLWEPYFWKWMLELENFVDVTGRPQVIPFPLAKEIVLCSGPYLNCDHFYKHLIWNLIIVGSLE